MASVRASAVGHGGSVTHGLSLDHLTPFVFLGWFTPLSVPAATRNIAGVFDTIAGGASVPMFLVYEGDGKIYAFANFTIDPNFTPTIGNKYGIAFYYDGGGTSGNFHIYIFADGGGGTAVAHQTAGQELIPSVNTIFALGDTTDFRSPDGEYTSWRLQTGQTFTEAELWTELTKLQGQKGTNSSRVEYELESTAADIHGVNERDGAGPNLTVVGWTDGVGRPTSLEGGPAPIPAPLVRADYSAFPKAILRAA